MRALMQPLEAIADYKEIRRRLLKNRGVTVISGTLDAQKAHIASGLAEDFPVTLIIAENELKAKGLLEDYRLYDPQVMHYPARDMIFYQAEISGSLLTRQRMQVIKALTERKKVTVITSIGGCMDYLLPFRVLKKDMITLSVGDELDLTEMSRKLVRIGYERCGTVEEPGQFAVRGGILDVYSMTEENPWRIELWGDEIDDIRMFDSESQRSVTGTEKIVIYPATEDIGIDEPDFYKKATDTFLEYLGGRSIVFLDEPARLMENAKVLYDEFRMAFTHRLEQGKATPEQAERMISPEQLQYLLNMRNTVALCLMQMHKDGFQINGQYSVQVQAVNPYNNQFPLLVKDMQKWKKNGFRVVFLSTSRTRAKRLAGELFQEKINAFYSEDPERELQEGEVLVTYGRSSRGFAYPMQKFVLITESDVFGQSYRPKKKTRKSEGERFRDFSELHAGDYVIHEDHGLGIYRGIEKVEIDNIIKDYIKVDYAESGSLYLPATQLDMLQKYSGAEGKKPKLDRLGGKEWIKTKTRVRGAVRNIAKELVELYSARSSSEGFEYGPDTVWQKEFEEMFPYEETEDQIKAIEETKRDMESKKIMDRLICGDVGFGKTEVAIRAAFKAVQENKQVVLLAPTTILAQQHYNTFVQRMKDFPVRVDLLCRFRTPAQQKKTIEDLKKGLVDIVIGTHRLLSKDVRFKDLGLLVIDEEQRFGVTHKEKIKQLKETVDVLSLTATPIPRTLHMSLIGIRDLSMLEEPPLDRMPIQTYVCEFDMEMVREAINRELSRGGQVYYVYNRVNDIADMAGRIARQVPEANVAFAHGQMSERQLEKIMYEFVSGEIDVLVSTTIIETGMDIPNVNTIIIHEADRLGLSQLYQLRGRVGRSNRTAYAFMMYKRDKMLKEVAEKRLHAIREFTELGSGVRIAMRDLEIRGAGNLLGAEQSGHMEAVGYDLYTKMLSQAISEAKGEKPKEEFETGVDLMADAFIPKEYIEEEGQKLDIYKRVAAIETQEEADNMLDELIDRYGEPPKVVQNLLRISLLRSKAHEAYIQEIKENSREIRFVLYEKAALDAARIPEVTERYSGKMKFRVSGNPYFSYIKNVKAMTPQAVLDTIEDFTENLKTIVLES